MADLCSGPAVEVAFDDLQAILLSVIKTIAIFKPTLMRLESTISKLVPIFKDIERLDTLLNRPQYEIGVLQDQLVKGKNLIQLCSKIKFWNLYKRYIYSKKLQRFDGLLSRLFQIDFQARQMRSLGEISVEIRNISNKFDTKKKEVFDDFLERLGSSRSTSGSSNISRRNSGSRYVGDVPQFTVALDLPLEELKVMLLEDKVVWPTVVLLSAPAGCGKTTLANMVCLDSKIKETFKENIFFVTVSHNVNIEVIVKTLFKQNGCLNELLKIRSEENAINQLGQLLKKIGGPNEDPILLVLDDLWLPGSEDLVQKFMYQGIPGYRILVTSRFDIPGIQSVYKLHLLNDEDAKLLFCHSAFPPESNHPHISNDLMNEMVKACKGVPSALNAVALSLRGKREVIWRARLDKWSKGQSDIFDSNNILP